MRFRESAISTENGVDKQMADKNQFKMEIRTDSL